MDSNQENSGEIIDNQPNDQFSIPTETITSQGLITTIWIEYVAPYGWFLLGLLIVVWWLHDYLAPKYENMKINKNLEKANNPSRREVLNVDLEKIREEQQRIADEKALEEAEIRKQKKEEKIKNAAKMSLETNTSKHQNPKSSDFNPLTGSSLPQYRLYI